ncbi:MT-A70 family methyltransferase [Streptococcus caviae]|uniref:MT-A70 family methyltransferase n=1 Tax=Streptococcus sp. 'caviae' TaxID=1915004 RepID=UPI00094B9971|nr:MT-A70 family methyltransferase [Streptococcus sp. 'caviae']OLN82537.1 modification methylase [Streptococcus sp. 'caviae']
MTEKKVSGYSIYNIEAQKRTKLNPLNELYPKLPSKKYDVIYADPPWDYGGKMQYDKSSNKDINVGFEKNIFISSASFKYPTVKLKELKKLDVNSIAKDDCLLFMWTTGPQMANSISLGEAWGFKYKTVAFVWDKMVHNPGQYTLSQTEFCLVFKRGRIPKPRGARNIRQFLQYPRGKHSVKPLQVIDRITKMFPNQEKIELFARINFNGWDNWGLEIPSSKIEIPTGEEDTSSSKNHEIKLF